MTNFFANIFGSLINYIYMVVKDYGLALILFTILMKVLTFFMTLKQKRDSIKTSIVQAEMKKIDEKHKHDVVTANRKKVELMQREKVSPFSSCLFFIVQIVILFAMLSVVSFPLTYIKKTPKEKIEKYNNILIEEKKEKEKSEAETKEDKNKNNENTVVANINTENAQKNEAKTEENINQENIVSNVKEENDATKVESNETNENVTENVVSNKKGNTKNRDAEINIIKRFGNEDEDVNLNMQFLGIDLTKVPNNEINNLQNNFSFENLKVFILPVAYVILSIVSSIISNKDMEKLTKLTAENNIENKTTSKYKKDEDKEDVSLAATMAQTNKNLIFLTPVLMFMVTMISPLALALYWFVSSLLTIIETKLIDKILAKEKEDNKTKLTSGEI